MKYKLPLVPVIASLTSEIAFQELYDFFALLKYSKKVQCLHHQEVLDHQVPTQLFVKCNFRGSQGIITSRVKPKGEPFL